jgi:hypothetical protein
LSAGTRGGMGWRSAPNDASPAMSASSAAAAHTVILIV